MTKQSGVQLLSGTQETETALAAEGTDPVWKSRHGNSQGQRTRLLHENFCLWKCVSQSHETVGHVSVDQFGFSLQIHDVSSHVYSRLLRWKSCTSIQSSCLQVNLRVMAIAHVASEYVFSDFLLKEPNQVRYRSVRTELAVDKMVTCVAVGLPLLLISLAFAQEVSVGKYKRGPLKEMLHLEQQHLFWSPVLGCSL